MDRKLDPRKVKIALFYGLLVLLVILFQESLFRIVFPMPGVLNFDRISYSVISPNDPAPPSRRPARLAHASFTLSSAPDKIEFTHKLNLHGFRDKEWALKKQCPRWGFVGDSFVEGFMAEANETIPVSFQTCADRDGKKIEAMNFGVGGVGFESYARLLHDAVPLFGLDAVFLVLYVNDLPGPPYDSAWLQGESRPIFYRPWIPHIFYIFGEYFRTGYVAKLWHASPFPFCAAVPDPSNPLTEHAHLISPAVDPSIVEAMRLGTFNPYQYNYLILLEQGLKLPVQVEPHLHQLDEFLKRHHCLLYVAYLPCRHQVSDRYIPFAKQCADPNEITSLMWPPYDTQNKTLRAVCTRIGVPLIDLTPGLIEQELKGNRMYWDYDSHMRGAGYTFVGERLYQFVTAGQ